jgi:hypothetical protein
MPGPKPKLSVTLGVVVVVVAEGVVVIVMRVRWSMLRKKVLSLRLKALRRWPRCLLKILTRVLRRRSRVPVVSPVPVVSVVRVTVPKTAPMLALKAHRPTLLR